MANQTPLWKSSAEAIAELRMKKFPGLLLNR
jgi:hypothetical protein